MTQQKFSAVVFDWAGTTIDFGSFAPMGAFVEAFASFDVEISIADARKPMGLPKHAHIAAILSEPHIAAAWAEARGNRPDEAAIDAVTVGVTLSGNAAGLTSDEIARLSSEERSTLHTRIRCATAQGRRRSHDRNGRRSAGVA